MSKDMVNYPEHYMNNDSFECIDEIVLIYGLEIAKGFCIGNAHKYRYRLGLKDPEKMEEDRAKSHWYMNEYAFLCGFRDIKDFIERHLKEKYPEKF